MWNMTFIARSQLKSVQQFSMDFNYPMNRFRVLISLFAASAVALSPLQARVPRWKSSAWKPPVAAVAPIPTIPILTILPPAAPRFKPLAVPAIVRAPAWIVVDVDSGRVLESFNPHKRMFPASTTKTMMALTALTYGHLDDLVTIGPNPPKTGEQSANLMQGEHFILRDLLRAALIKSANDACVAVAEGVAGTVPNFVRLMNAKSKEIGARDSHWMNPHGLHDPQHYTTPYDLAQIARADMRYAFFNDTIKTRVTSIHGNWKIGTYRVLENKNRLLWEWQQCDGVKTGYTRQAGRCLVASATQNVRDADGAVRPWRLIAVVMHSPDSWGESANLLINAFKNFRPTSVVKEDQTFAPIDVQNGAGQVQPIATRAVEVPLKAGESVSNKLRFLKLQAPVHRGQRVGELEVWSGLHPIARVPLMAQSDVPVSVIASIVPNTPLAPSNKTLLIGVAGVGALGLALLLMRRTRESARPNHVQKRTH